MFVRSFSPASIASSLVQFSVGALELLLGLRFILRLFSANQSAPFVTWIYSSSQIFLSPFKDIFPTTVLDQNFVIEFTTIFAIIVYAVASYLVCQFLFSVERHFESFVSRQSPTSIERQYKK